jgi:hypothetical protein
MKPDRLYASGQTVSLIELTLVRARTAGAALVTNFSYPQKYAPPPQQ